MTTPCIKHLRRGILYPFFEQLCELLQKISLGEAIKGIVQYFAIPRDIRNLDKPSIDDPDITDEKRANNIALCKQRRLYILNAARLAIDLHHILKFGIVGGLWIMADCLEPYNFLCGVIVAYLLFYNIFTSFYFQVWGSPYGSDMSHESMRTRYIMTMLSICFYIMAYAYLYNVHFEKSITWPEGQNRSFWEAVYLSVANSFTLTYGPHAPQNIATRWLMVSQVLNTFFFATITISNAIPNLLDRGNIDNTPKKTNSE